MLISRADRLHQIDGLRAVAISLVVYHHSINGSVASALERVGFADEGALLRGLFGSGVELFFVISGLVLALPYYRGRKPVDATGIGRYYRRRVERLWPPFLVAWFAAGLVILTATRIPTWYSMEILPKFGYADWLGQVFIINPGFPAYNAAWWSLNIELVFYAVFPLLLLLLRQLPTRLSVLLALLLGTCAIAELHHAGLLLEAPAGMPFLAGAAIQLLLSLLTYLPCFVGGMILAAGAELPRGLCIGFIAAGAVYAVVATIVGANFHVGFALFYFGIAGLSLRPRGFLGELLSRPLIVWLGERSYSLFLIHFTVFYAVNDLISALVATRGLGYFLATRMLGVPLALAAAMMLFHFVERRFANGLATAEMLWPPLRGMRRGDAASISR